MHWEQRTYCYKPRTHNRLVFFPNPELEMLLRTVLTRCGASLKKNMSLSGAYRFWVLCPVPWILTSRWFGLALSLVDAMTWNRKHKILSKSARLIMRVPKYSNITPVLKELHWLPVRERVCFKIMLIVHRAVNCRGPVYLRDLICIYTPTRALRSEGTKQLKRPKTNCKAGDASFPAAAPDLWNRLPFSLRELCNENSFKNA